MADATGTAETDRGLWGLHFWEEAREQVVGCGAEQREQHVQGPWGTKLCLAAAVREGVE